MPVTDEDIVRDLFHRYTEHVQPPDSIAAAVTARQHRRDRHRRVVSAAAAGAALAAAAGVIAVVPGQASHLPGTARPSTGKASATGKAPAIKLTANEVALYKLSSAAASQPTGHGRYVVMMTEGQDLKDTSVIDSLTGDLWSYQKGTDGNPSGGGSVSKHYSPTAAQFAAIPTGTAALRSALIAQWNAANEAVPNSLRKFRAQHHIHPTPIPESNADRVFQQATFLLWNPLVGPDLRSALYRVLATVPGVTVNSSAHDATGRPAVEISRTDDSGLPGGRSDGSTYATYENPTTGTLLETAITYPPGSGATTPQDPQGTATTVDVTVYLSITRSGTIPSNPYGG